MDQEAEARSIFDQQALKAVREAYAIDSEVRSSPTLRKLATMCQDDVLAMLKKFIEVDLRTDDGLKAGLRLQDELVVRRSILDMLNGVTNEAEQTIKIHEGEPEGQDLEDRLPED